MDKNIEILKKVKLLKEINVYINEDYPKKIFEQRKELV